jgi:ferrous iron transport protein B
MRYHIFMRIALIGNPNSGKTTLFNELTGANQHVGNWPGVTVEKKEGAVRPLYGTGDVVDLPGIYSLSPFSLEEIVSRDFIIDEKPDVVIDILDATNLERNLYLAIQLIELNVPLVIALNMMDEVEREGYHIDTDRLSHDLGVPVVPISAARKTGLQSLMASLPKARPSRRHELPNPHLERLIALTEALLNDHLIREHHLGDAIAEGYPLHWAAIKALESDDLVLRHLTLDEETSRRIDELKNSFEEEHALLCTAFADARYRFIHRLVYHGVTVWSADGHRHRHLEHAHTDFHHHRQRDLRRGSLGDAPEGFDSDIVSGHADHSGFGSNADAEDSEKPGFILSPSDRIDRVLTHRIWAIPLFLVVMFAVFHLTFSESLFGIAGLPGPGVLLQTLVENGIAAFSGAIATLFEPGSWAESLVVDGIIGGVGAVLSFVPKILLLFLFLTLLEDCGYMARAAFIMDRILRRFGLSGKSFLPMLMGFGCTVPAAMACRTMENEQDRKLTLMLVPFMSCGARAPIFLVFAGAFFPESADFVVFGMYLLGILIAVLSGILLRKVLFKGEFSPFIIELPRYRAPRARSVTLTLWDKFKGYLVRAGTIIFAMCVVVWFFSSFGFTGAGFGMTDINDSLLASVGNLIVPLFLPLGFGVWTAAVAVLTGFIAKESVVGTLGVLLNVGEDEAVEGNGLSAAVLTAAGFSPLVALSFMVFCLLYIPCMAAFATLKKEFGSWRWAFGQAAYSTMVAYFVAFVVYQVGSLIL